MNENIDLTKILKGVPIGTKLYSPIFGEIKFAGIRIGFTYPIQVEITGGNKYGFTSRGHYIYNLEGAEVLIFPSRDQRDWSKFKVPKKKVKVTLHPFDKVLVRDTNEEVWRGMLLLQVVVKGDYPYICMVYEYEQCIPYIAETANLIGTAENPSVEYEIEFDKSFKFDNKRT